MPRRISFCFLIAAALIGCGSPPVKVYVNLDKVVASSRKPNITVEGLRPKAFPKQFEISGSVAQPEVVLSADQSAQISQLQKKLELEAEQAIDATIQRIKQLQGPQVAEIESEEKEKNLPKEKLAYDDYYKKTRAIFDKYAQDRDELLIELTLLANNTDPVLIDQIDEKLPPREKRRQTRIKEIQQLLKAKDRGYDEEIAKLRAEYRSNMALLLDELNRSIQERRKELDQKTAELARKQVRAFSQSISGRFSSSKAIVAPKLPATAGAKIPITSPKPGPSFEVISPIPALDKRTLQSHLDIWLKLNHYEWAPANEAVRDATEEFNQWRMNHLLLR